jgi:phage major head subunit gpT-like protein
MSSPVAQRGQYGDLYGSSMLPVLEELFRSELAQHPSRREQLFKTVSTDRDIWQYSEIHDMDLFNEVAEGTEYSFKRPKQGSNKTLSVAKFGLGFSISEEMVEDGKFDMIADMVRKLARSGRESQEIQAMNIFNNGFSSELTADGSAVFSTSHALPSGSSFRNKLSVDADLSVTSLETMLKDFETQFVGDSGIIYNVAPKILLVHPENKRLAKELIGSELKADTPNNNINSFRDEGLMVISSPHLVDSDAWFMLGMPEETGLRIVSRKPIETKAAGPDVGFATDAIYYKSRYREKIGCTHGYGIFGTQGA